MDLGKTVSPIRTFGATIRLAAWDSTSISSFAKTLGLSRCLCWQQVFPVKFRSQQGRPWGQQGGIPMKDMPAYCQEILNMIEWANGDPATSKWAKMRAEAGHPEPFGLKYVGIGNEDIISTTFEERYEMICKAIKAKYPNMIVVGTVGPFHDPSADYVEGWKFAKEHNDILDLVDEHYYESPGWFMHHQDYYDHYDRNAPKVYLGEYASRTRTVESALAEAMYLCGLERNGDVVSMTSYAPLLCKDGYSNWNPT